MRRDSMGKNKSEKNKLEKRKMYVLSAFIFIISIAFIFVLGILNKDKSFSEVENRMLAEKPKVTVTGIINGRYMKQYESYESDQFVGRDMWVRIKTRTDLLIGKRESNGVFKGKDNYLLEDITVTDRQSYKENIEAMKVFKEQYSEMPMSVLIAPNASNVLSDKLPSFAVTVDQNVELENMKKSLGKELNWIDASKALKKHKKENIYYKTDHHWTSLGAYYTFKEAAKTLEIDEAAVPMKSYVVSNSFNGTLSSKSGYETTHKEPMYIYTPEEDKTEFVVNYINEQKKSSTIYDASKLKKKDKYAMFLGGNNPLVDIKTTVENKKRILVLKDSYANCFIPFLLPHYRELVIVDPRYYYGNINELMKSYHISEVLFLYNANTFFGDNSLSGVIAPL